MSGRANPAPLHASERRRLTAGCMLESWRAGATQYKLEVQEAAELLADYEAALAKLEGAAGYAGEERNEQPGAQKEVRA